MRLVTHILVMISCAVTCTMVDSIGHHSDSLCESLHARPAVSLSHLLADTVHEKLHPDLGLCCGSDSLRTHHTAQPALSVDDPTPETLSGLTRMRSLEQLRRLAQLCTATNPGKTVRNQADPAGNPGKPAGNRGASVGNPGEPAGNPGDPAGNQGVSTGNPGEPAGRIPVNETTGENIDYESNFAAKGSRTSRGSR